MVHVNIAVNGAISILLHVIAGVISPVTMQVRQVAAPISDATNSPSHTQFAVIPGERLVKETKRQSHREILSLRSE
jgi:hypothetical protein